MRVVTKAKENEWEKAILVSEQNETYSYTRTHMHPSGSDRTRKQINTHIDIATHGIHFHRLAEINETTRYNEW